jgi:hypothetical protein
MRIITLAGYLHDDPIIDRRAIWMTRPFDLQFAFVDECQPGDGVRTDYCCTDPSASSTPAPSRPDDCP